MRLATPRRQANKVLIDKRKYQFSRTIVETDKTGPTIYSLRLLNAEAFD